MTAAFDVASALGAGVLAPSHAWDFVRRFADEWLGAPLHDQDGFAEPELDDAESHLGFELPPVLRHGYALFGRRDDLTRRQDPLVPPAGLHVDDGLDGVLGYAGVISLGEASALVLGDEPATTCYVPAGPMFVRWLAADSETELLLAAEAALADPATPWEDCGLWATDGDAVLMDSAEAGADLEVEYPAGSGFPEQAAVPITAGTWRVRAVHREGDHGWVGVVQLLPAS